MLLISSLPASAQQPQSPPTAHDDSILQRRYDAAQKFQAANDLDHAAQQYRIFIADALEGFALGRARAGQYDKAANDFDTALILVPDFPAMKIQYAAVALDPTFENGYELAIAELDLGDGPDAAKIFSEMLASLGDTATIHMYFGQAYGRSDFQNDAVAEFEKAIAKRDKLPGVHYSLAAAYLSTSGSSKLTPESDQCFAAAGTIFSRGTTPWPSSTQ